MTSFIIAVFDLDLFVVTGLEVLFTVALYHFLILHSTVQSGQNFLISKICSPSHTAPGQSKAQGSMWGVMLWNYKVVNDRNFILGKKNHAEVWITEVLLSSYIFCEILPTACLNLVEHWAVVHQCILWVLRRGALKSQLRPEHVHQETHIGHTNICIWAWS